ncbi:MAG TPA: hypothetical protein VF627_08225 [Abditibacterium sp.]|jgi:hypothetical protein
MSKSINVSPVSYANWLKLVFDHPAAPRDEDGNSDVVSWWYWQEGLAFHVSNKTRLVQHMTRLCREFKIVAASYSLPQINQGIWFLLSARIEFPKLLADATVPVESRIECVRSMFWVFADFVKPSEVEAMENCFHMWWDLVCDSHWNAHLWRLKGDEIMVQMQCEEEDEDAQLSPEDKARQQQMTEILSQLKPGEDAEAALQNHGFSFNEFPCDDRPRSSTQIDIEWKDLAPDELRVIDAMLETLTKILDLDEIRCEEYALHGLNHLNHPRRVQTVQDFIDSHSHEWDKEALAWVESCRDGTAM